MDGSYSWTNVTVVNCHSRRFVRWTLSLGQNVAWSVCGWTDRQGPPPPPPDPQPATTAPPPPYPPQQNTPESSKRRCEAELLMDGEEETSHLLSPSSVEHHPPLCHLHHSLVTQTTRSPTSALLTLSASSSLPSLSLPSMLTTPTPHHISRLPPVRLAALAAICCCAAARSITIRAGPIFTCTTK